jgi:hypothetical protein
MLEITLCVHPCTLQLIISKNIYQIINVLCESSEFKCVECLIGLGADLNV